MTARTVLVTRPRQEAAILAAALAARGLDPLVEPLLEIRFGAAPLPDLAGVQAILCTSGNGVRALARATGRRDLPLFAVGEATAARARALGFAEVASAGGTVVDLVQLAASRLTPAGGRLLHVAGSAAAGDLAGALRLCGFAVERAVRYEARPAAALSPAAIAALHAGRVGYALFFSPRTAAVFARLAGLAAIVEDLAGVAALSISAAADAAIGGLPWRERHIAANPDRAALLAALDGALGELARRGEG